MFSCLIIDDNEQVIDNIVLIFTTFFADKVKIAGTATNARHGIDLILQHRPDALFLDAHMPGMGGMAVVSYLYKNRIYNGIETIKVLLYTGRTEVYETIVGSELKYPIRIQDKGVLTIDEYGTQLDLIAEWISSDRQAKTFKVDNQSVYADDIAYLKSKAPISEIHLKTRKHPIVSGYPLAHYKSQINNEIGRGQHPLPGYFFFATNDYILNRQYIDSYQAEEVFLKDGQIVGISRSHLRAFEAWWFD